MDRVIQTLTDELRTLNNSILNIKKTTVNELKTLNDTIKEIGVTTNNELNTLNDTIKEIGLTTNNELKKKIEENEKKDSHIDTLQYRQGRFLRRLKQLKSELNEFYKTNTTNESCTTNIIPSNEVVEEEIDGGKKPKRKSKSRKTKARKSKVYSIKKVFKNKTIKT
jgi:uncharacterized protein with von Willebrand factor type A (vWA) domain